MDQLNNKSIIIGLTGATGSGKTTIASILQQKNCFIVDADKIAKNILKNNVECKKKLCSYFGNDICTVDGTIDNKRLAKLAFATELNTGMLNQITHPFILEAMYDEIKYIQASNNQSIIVIDAPLLFECELDKICNFVIVADAQSSVRLERIKIRDNISESMALMRMRVQKNRKYYTDRADYIINTQNDKYHLQEKVENCLHHIKESL